MSKLMRAVSTFKLLHSYYIFCRPPRMDRNTACHFEFVYHFVIIKNRQLGLALHLTEVHRLSDLMR